MDLWRLGPPDVEYARRRGGQLWAIRWLCQYNTYGFPRHFAGLGLDKAGVDGFAEWTYYGAATYRPYEQIVDRQGCHYAFVDDAGRLLTTITWEAVQEGIDDARYLATLRQLIDKARASDDPEHRALAAAGQRTLDQVLAELPSAPRTAPEAKLDELRARLADRVTAFVRAGRRPSDRR